ncbi:unnamed protein product [Mytilus edulis]|uniref:Uncharacterized protein n=1 Tax=Mytilus edulis TaxID=6550 RepID=A0A8S3UAY6_MYTED|nr:unnamed protein product [Mytilus edulis]
MKKYNTNNIRRKKIIIQRSQKHAFQSNSSQNHTNNFPDDATDLCTRLDDLIVNMRGDETDFINDDRANSFNENEINQDHFLETPIPRKVRLKEAEQINPKSETSKTNTFDHRLAIGRDQTSRDIRITENQQRKQHHPTNKRAVSNRTDISK